MKIQYEGVIFYEEYIGVIFLELVFCFDIFVGGGLLERLYYGVK